MGKIETNGWKKFPCEKLFECKNTGNILARDVIDGSGTTPYVTASAFNNGVFGYIDASGYDIIPGHCILVGGKTFTITYQKKDFVSNDSHNFTIRVRGANISELSYLFLTTMIYEYFGQKYSWNDAVTKSRLLAESIPLPTDTNGNPDWLYMENYMKKIMSESAASLSILENIKQVDDEKHKIDTSRWGTFHLYDDCLFDIDMGTKLDKAKMTSINPSVNFVGRANTNNGITDRVDLINGLPPYLAGNMTLSLGGEYLGSCFIQPDQFYTSQNVVVLIPKHEMSDNVKQFISVMVFREGRLHYKAFVEELNKHIKTDFVIRLPVTNDGEPDWQYMEDYMQDMMQAAENNINALSDVII